MSVERRPIITSPCEALCAKARLCHGINPIDAVALAISIADRPYGGCNSSNGPSITTLGERCHLDPEVQSVLGGMAAGMKLEAGETVVANGPINQSTGRLSELAVKKTVKQKNMQIMQSAGYMR